LKELDLRIEKGSFVCIIGDVGAGKSSFFSAIIGDMIYVPESEIS
jgi:ABC-type nitrate/sulfonate/bicarbonate transport system ATPase subunit